MLFVLLDGIGKLFLEGNIIETSQTSNFLKDDELKNVQVRCISQENGICIPL